MSTAVTRLSRASLACLFGITLVATISAGSGSANATAETFTVTSIGDPGDGVCDAVCTLREAIVAANASPGSDAIRFALPDSASPYVIKVAPVAQGGGPLPPLTDPVSINGLFTTAWSHYVILEGSNAGPAADGLTVNADGTVIEEMRIKWFSGAGIVVDGADNVRLERNTSGGNGSDGIRFQSGSSGGVITGNQILSNDGDGVRIVSGAGNDLRANEVFGNDGLGIDLGDDGVTANDPADVDEGANGLQNAPTVTAPRDLFGVYDPVAELRSTPNTSFLINFYRSWGQSQWCDPSTYGEGGTDFFSTTITTDEEGYARADPGAPSPPLEFGETISATATNLVTGDTSEFSNCVRIGYARAVVSMTASPEQVHVGDLVTLSIRVENPGPEDAYSPQLGIGIPMATEIVSMTTSTGGGCGRRSDVTIWCDLDDVAIGSSASATLELRPQMAGRQTSHVTLAGPNIETEPKLWEIHSRATVVVGCTEVGTSGDDVLVGTAGDDILCGKGGDDVLRARGGNDLLLGGRGNDILRGGTGFDSASFSGAPRAVRASLTDGTAEGSGNDTLRGIQGLIGSHYGDTLVGDAGSNLLKGLQSKDTLYARGGNDRASLRDRYRDFFSGGRGRDSARVDTSGDSLASVETTRRG